MKGRSGRGEGNDGPDPSQQLMEPVVTEGIP